jgi:N-acetyl-gamma-glutamyl-phosphate reductase
MSAPSPAAAPATGPRLPRLPVIVLGGSGYVAGELLRLLAGHPGLRVEAAVSASRAGEPIAAAFPHLAGCHDGLVFTAPDELEAALARHQRWATFSAAPHGASAPLVDALLGRAEAEGIEVRLVDLSADFRYATAEGYAAVYGRPHGAPARLGDFRSALPEHLAETPRHVGHPGCFTTAALLAAVPLVALDLVEPRLWVVATTGSTGAGRGLTETTHHPERRSNLFAYAPLAHRHAPEMRALLAAATGREAELRFVPQAGPFARGIYATVQAQLARPLDAAAAAAALADFYRGAPFVAVGEEPARLADVAGSNRARLGVAARDGALVVTVAIDNLVKGAAGGGVQWMNRMLGIEETAGLLAPGLGWI